jgi:hypothetical protein
MSEIMKLKPLSVMKHEDGRTQTSGHVKSLGGTFSHPVSGGYKNRNLALQVRGVSDEIIKYGREFCGISTQE